ncbi:MAG TPA: hypothetical protein VGV36_00855 [Solirubrobacteraceae bacterium]|nr:hypothetical protein [Solirubrobacteraceae bacterium]
MPALVGQTFDLALERIERASFEADVEGGGLFGVVEEDNWEVVASAPTPASSSSCAPPCRSSWRAGNLSGRRSPLTRSREARKEIAVP